jgi:hypothetical protein
MEPSQPSHDQNDSPAKNYYEDGSHLVSNMQTTRPISMVVSGPMSGNRREDGEQEIIDRSAQASSFPLQMQNSQTSHGSI